MTLQEKAGKKRKGDFLSFSSHNLLDGYLIIKKENRKVTFMADILSGL